jgi:predicted ATPase/DNA-binding winged helix-turn-helix (wHTH) protein
VIHCLAEWMPSRHHPVSNDVIAFGPFRLSAAERLIERDGLPVQIGGRAMDILIALVERAGDVVSQRELIDRVWPNVTVDDGSLRYHISGLRRSLGDGLDGARYVINVAGRGYCFVSPTTEPGWVKSPPPGAPKGSAHPMPPRFTRMVGRDATVELISAQLAASRFVTLVGSGGIGKTTVAVSVGYALAAEYDAVCFADLGSLPDPRLAPNLLAASLGVVVHTEEVIPGLVGRLRDNRTLLILDSCEHVIETISILAEAIFEQAPGVHILATSREALRVKGEHVHRLASLDCPPTSDTLTAAEAITYSAARLFADRVFAMRDEDAPRVARICNKLDGIPLAIELAAGRVETHGVEGVEALLDSRLSLLWQGRRTAPPRQQTLNATLDWSYDLLTEAEQSILRRLAPFVGAFTLEGAEHLARDDDIDQDVVVAAIARLVAKSLIVSDIDGRRLRYRLLDTTRAYLRGKLAEAGEARVVARRHAEYFHQFLERAGVETRAFSEARVLGPFGEDVGNVRSALEWSFSAGGDAQLAIGLAAAATPLFLEMSLLT